MKLIFDIETTGLPNLNGYKFGSFPCPYQELSKYDSSRIVSISMMLVDDQYEEIDFYDYIVKRDNFNIPNSHFHGITNEKSDSLGVSMELVAKTLLYHMDNMDTLVAHNINFDYNILISELLRIGKQSLAKQLATKRKYCTMKSCTNMVGVKNNRGLKFPKLEELYTFVHSTKMKNAHASKYDVINLHSCVKKLFDNGTLPP